MKVKIFTDGGSRGNPGNAGFGMVVYDQGEKVIYEYSEYLGTKTNNEAEYSGLIFGLNWLKGNEEELEIDQAVFNADSELIVKQMLGLYKVKAGNLLDLNQQAKKLVSEVKSIIEFRAIKRELNARADELANRAMDNRK